MSLADGLYSGCVFGVLVVLIAAVHLTFVAYVTFGGFLALRWPATIWLHVAVLLYGVAIEVLDFTCPLTTWEIWARQRAGMQPLAPGGFIDTYVSGPLLGSAGTHVELTALLTCVLTSWVLFIVLRGSDVLAALRGRTAGGSPPRPYSDSAPDIDVR